MSGNCNGFTHIGVDEIPVAASGISSRQDIEANLLSGIFNFLIGESLVRAENRAEQVSRLIRG